MKMYQLVRTKWAMLEVDFNTQLQIGEIISFHVLNVQDEDVAILFHMNVNPGFKVGDIVSVNSPGFVYNGQRGMVMDIKDGGMISIDYPMIDVQSCIYYKWVNRFENE